MRKNTVKLPDGSVCCQEYICIQTAHYPRTESGREVSMEKSTENTYACCIASELKQKLKKEEGLEILQSNLGIIKKN